MTIDSDVIQLANRVGACAVGLAFAERSDAEALRELADMADGSDRALTQARARLTDLGTVDESVLYRALHLLDAAAASLPEPDHGSEPGAPEALLAGPGR